MVEEKVTGCGTGELSALNVGRGRDFGAPSFPAEASETLPKRERFAETASEPAGAFRCGAAFTASRAADTTSRSRVGRSSLSGWQGEAFTNRPPLLRRRPREGGERDDDLEAGRDLEVAVQTALDTLDWLRLCLAPACAGIDAWWVLSPVRATSSSARGRRCGGSGRFVKASLRQRLRTDDSSCVEESGQAIKTQQPRGRSGQREIRARGPASQIAAPSLTRTLGAR